MNQHNLDLIQKLEDTWCAQDIPAMQALFTDDCVYEDMAMGAVNHGKDGLRKFAEEVFHTMPDFRVRFVKKLAVQDAGAAEWVIDATWNGLFEGKDCSGQKIQFTGFSMYEFRDGKIKSARDCWDYTALVRIFGVLPESLRTLL
jgi:steroid delta-isomerase-like uncharacterized protein